MKDLDEYIFEGLFDTINLNDVKKGRFKNHHVAWADFDKYYLDFDESQMIDKIETLIKETVAKEKYDKKQERENKKRENFNNFVNKYFITRAFAASMRALKYIFGPSLEKLFKQYNISHQSHKGPYIHIEVLPKNYDNSPDPKIKKIFFDDVYNQIKYIVGGEETIQLERDDTNNLIWIYFATRYEYINPYFVYKLNI